MSQAWRLYSGGHIGQISIPYGDTGACLPVTELATGPDGALWALFYEHILLYKECATHLAAGITAACYQPERERIWVGTGAGEIGWVDVGAMNQLKLASATSNYTPVRIQIM